MMNDKPINPWFVAASVGLIALIVYGKIKLAVAAPTLGIIFLGGLVFAISTPALAGEATAVNPQPLPPGGFNPQNAIVGQTQGPGSLRPPVPKIGGNI